MTISRRIVLKALAATPSLSLAQTAPWPNKSIRFVVPFVPGGTSDILARPLAAELTKQLNVLIVIENKGGGGGVPAMQDVAKSPADGYHLIMTHIGSMAVNPLIFPNSGYDVNRDFAPITLISKVPSLFVVHPDVPAKTFKEFVAYVKKNPGKLNYGSAGNASAGHLAVECLKMVSGMFMTHIPYRGTGPALIDLLAGRTQFFSAGTPALMPYIKQGKLRLLATGSPKRIPSFPDVPTVAESGFPNWESQQWYGVAAPGATPAPIVQRLQQEFAKALRSPTITERYASEDAIAGGNTPEEFAKFIREQQALWKDVVLKAKIKPD